MSPLSEDERRRRQLDDLRKGRATMKERRRAERAARPRKTKAKRAEPDQRGQHPNSLANLSDRPPPAETGNTRQQTHGALNDRIIGPRAQELAEQILEHNGQLDHRNHPAVLRLATHYARIERTYEWLEDQPDPVFASSRKGRAHGIFERLERWERAASQEEDRLAISPLTRAKLGLDLAKAADLATAMSEPDPERRRRLMAEAGFEEGDE